MREDTRRRVEGREKIRKTEDMTCAAHAMIPFFCGDVLLDTCLLRHQSCGITIAHRARYSAGRHNSACSSALKSRGSHFGVTSIQHILAVHGVFGIPHGHIP